MRNDLLATITQIARVEQSWIAQARERQNHLTKPPGSLGKLEEIACRMAAIQQTLSPSVDRKRIIVFAADHGVAEEGVSPYPSEVTTQMVANFLRGGAAINALAKTARADLVIVDAGVKSPTPTIETSGEQIQFIQRPIRKGSRNFTKEPALTPDETSSAIRLGHKVVADAKRTGVNLIGIGEMGIGNTTAAAAITAALTGLPAATVTGRGTGADDEILARKRFAVEQALRLHAPKADDALRILQTLGGLEVAGLVGVCLESAAARIAIVCDGFIATASAALAVRLCPACADYMFAAHLTSEPGHAALLHIIGQEPLLKLDMRLGEGTGSALAMNVIDAAVNAFSEMATFESAGVSDKQVLVKEAAN
jgi:nicotinate-nucleotide--dimethylbenzimidazole phosphoribosyltransferase